jgi:hypothetical protein
MQKGERMNTTRQETYGPKGESIGTVVTTGPSAESSVEIATDSKGQSKLTVKVYAETASKALAEAIALYKRGQRELSGEDE